MHRLAFAVVVTVLSLLLASLSGCSNRDSRPVTGPDGKQWLAVTCTDGADNCWKEAAERCPRGYVTADSHHSTTTSAIGAPSGGLVAYPSEQGQMLIRCREAGESGG